MTVGLLVTLAAGAGAVARYLLDRGVTRLDPAPFPVGTTVVNVTGSLLLGLVTGLALHHGLPRTPTLVIGTGFAGGYTTLSTWAWESLALAEESRWAAAAVNALGSVVGGLAAAAVGLAIALL